MSVQKPIIIDQAELALGRLGGRGSCCQECDSLEASDHWRTGSEQRARYGRSGVPTRYAAPPSPPRARRDILRRQWPRSHGNRRSRSGDWTGFSDLHPVQRQTCCPLYRH